MPPFAVLHSATKDDENHVLRLSRRIPAKLQHSVGSLILSLPGTHLYERPTGAVLVSSEHITKQRRQPYCILRPNEAEVVGVNCL